MGLKEFFIRPENEQEKQRKAARQRYEQEAKLAYEEERGKQLIVAARQRAIAPPKTPQSTFKGGLAAGVNMLGMLGKMGSNFGSSGVLSGGNNRGLKNGGFSGYTAPKMDFGFGTTPRKRARKVRRKPKYQWVRRKVR